MLLKRRVQKGGSGHTHGSLPCLGWTEPPKLTQGSRAYETMFPGLKQPCEVCAISVPSKMRTQGRETAEVVLW